MTACAIVTGGAGDIGRAIVKRLLADGFHVESWDRDSGRLAENDAMFSGLPHVSRTVDLLDSESVAAAAGAERKAQLRVLVNNAGGVTESVTLKSTSEADFRLDLELNLTAAWRCIDHFKEALKGGGAIINIASINGTGVYGFPGYSAAKAGLLQLTRFGAVEFGKEGIRVNAIAPGTVRTQAWDSRIEKDPEIFERAARWYPMKDICRPEDIAGAVSFLAGPDARMITGITLPVDGGLSAGIDIVAGGLSQSDV